MPRPSEAHAAIEWPPVHRTLCGGWEFQYTPSGPCLLAPTGERFGPSDLLSAPDVARMRGIRKETLNAYLTRGQSAAGSGWIKVGTSAGWAIHAADALKP